MAKYGPINFRCTFRKYHIINRKWCTIANFIEFNLSIYFGFRFGKVFRTSELSCDYLSLFLLFAVDELILKLPSILAREHSFQFIDSKARVLSV